MIETILSDNKVNKITKTEQNSKRTTVIKYWEKKLAVR